MGLFDFIRAGEGKFLDNLLRKFPLNGFECQQIGTEIWSEPSFVSSKIVCCR